MNITGDLSRSAASPTLDTETHHPDDVANPGNIVDNNHLELVPYQKEITVDEEKPPSDPRALVPPPSLEAEALAIVPLNQKPKRTELAQRRTRRPFSVTEVEALVQAVEELGTGRYYIVSCGFGRGVKCQKLKKLMVPSHRWRDVKLRAFEDADHRTYVDLKVNTPNTNL